MRIYDNFPQPMALKAQELKVLKFLMYDKLISENGNLCNITSDANLSFYQLKDHRTKILDFESQINSDINNEGYSVHFGGLVTTRNSDLAKYDQYSYYIMISICEAECDKPIRKYHFDYANPSNVTRREHPIFHLHYCGELTPKLKEDGYDLEHLHPRLSRPRISIFPISLSSLMHLIFKDFCDPVLSRKITERTEWRELVRAGEKLVLKPYYKNCHSFFTRNPEDCYILHDFYYLL